MHTAWADLMNSDGAERSAGWRVPAGAAIAAIGGGLTGIDTATEMAESYPKLRVSLWTEGRLGDKLSGRGRAYLKRTFEQFGIALHEGQRVAAILAQSLALAAGAQIPYDVCIWAGFFAAPVLARQAGLSVNARGQALVDPYLRSTSHSNIYVAGDSAAFIETPGAPIRLACATAMPMGAQAADNLAAVVKQEAQQPFSFAYALQCISLGRKNGLVRWVHQDDRARERFISGRQAAMVKELICQYTTWSLWLEKLIPGAYRWPGQGKIRLSEPTIVTQM